ILTSSPSLILRAGVEQLQNPPTLPSPPVPESPPPVVLSSAVVFEDDFENGAKPQWSDTRTSRTPIGNRGFLGEFNSDTVSLTLDNLPPHDQVTIAFDLFIIRSWDGNRTDFGPDLWTLNITGRPPILLTTFINDNPNLNPGQAYPGQFPGDQFIGGTGGSHVDLGYPFRERSIDSVYRIDRSVRHTDRSLYLNFADSLTEGILDESWGLDNITVSVEETSSPIPVDRGFSDFITMPTRSDGSITTGDIITFGGAVILSGTGDITLNGSIRSRGGDISLVSGQNIDLRREVINSLWGNGRGGDVSLTATGNILESPIISGGGNVSFSSGGTINTGVEVLNSAWGNGQGGSVILTATGDIIGGATISGGGDIHFDSGGTIDTRLGRIDSRFGDDRGGVISLIAEHDIATETIQSGGRDLELIAGETIDTTQGEIDSFHFSVGGNINIRSNGNISLANVRSSGDLGGGNVEISTLGDLSIKNSSLLTSAFKLGTGGDVDIHARNVNFERSRIITGNIIPSISAGNISIDAEELISLSGLTPREETADISSAISTAS
ncbi:MAG: hypothetical protein WBB29_18215, partial [Geitlerinemataceae cyanobacterium]